MNRVSLSPTATFFGLFLIFVAMLYAGASQANGAAYLLLFLILSLSLVSLVHTWANVKGTRFELDAATPVFAGQELRIPVEVLNPGGREKWALRISFPSAGSDFALVDEVPPFSAARTEVRFLAARRGWHSTGKLRISSTFPIGFLRASCTLPADRRYLVYPKPGGNLPLPSSSTGALQQLREGLDMEGDDFSGVRAYQQGESQRHIDWKAAARGHPLMVKQFSADSDETIHLTWESLSHLMPEERLSQLALWIIKAERGSSIYGLRLPGTNLAPARGDEHCQACLTALAVFPGEEA